MGIVWVILAAALFFVALVLWALIRMGATSKPEPRDPARWQSCRVPPPGWWCSRPAGHEGPCAARPDCQTIEEYQCKR